MTIALSIVLNTVTLLLVVFIGLAMRSTSWYQEQTRLWLTNPAEARAREAAKPATVRTYERITRKNR